MAENSQIDEKILQVVDELRAQTGACSLGQMSARLRMGKETIRWRCSIMRERGLIDWTSNVAGSIRRPVDTSQRLLVELIAEAVMTEAALEPDVVPDGVRHWCQCVVEDAKRTVWPVPASEQEMNLGGDVATDDGTAPVVEVPTTNCVCVPCGRDFKGVAQLLGHERSKSHATRLAELGL